ncbi:molybdopterin synthase catalytic subunit isoform X5 [Rissa tridactyla]|uniref:molybdopterin synthase catalytic subunit isoform X5 n=1 Tax=Rissa tridactyla TaxID=75485 RepID=UPI0023BA4425|nr:molybdopterin synthase catalytic subunit isoform X5 [Rissa tridactyla]
MSCQVSVLYFARSAELAGLRCETLRVPRQVTSLQLWEEIVRVHPSVVPITEASVIIAVSSPHRAESLEAVAYCINTLKASVPIWKKASSSLSSFPTMLLLKYCIVLFRHMVRSSQSCCQEVLLLTNSVHSIKCRA